MLAQHDELERDIAEVIDTRVPRNVRVIGATLSENPNSPTGLVMQGMIDQNTLRFLKVESEYQRPLQDRSDIYTGFREGAVMPAIDIGVRGQDYIADGNDIVIQSQAFIVDGWQRVGTAMRLLEQTPNFPIRLPCLVHFGTTLEWESRRFDDLNKKRRAVSPDLHLRNARQGNNGLLTLYGLSNNQRDFVLYKRICWSQNMQRGEMLKATVMAKAILMLHSKFVSKASNNTEAIARSMSQLSDNITLPVLRQNSKEFFGTIDTCWPFTAIEYRRKAVQLKSGFLIELARVLADHANFWSENRLVISIDDQRKMSGFPINDPEIIRLACSSGMALKILYRNFVDHMNSGRRTNRLVEL